ncbi:hypothetical protein GN958_ATG03938 [Phytophthora infestans]|uniref:Uncharacterized protein n=1 Tax=Phytophthora infestans TaxID=4787 RepID=A0A8S9V6N3_PHYIN|nr:hypothetical protein GN958_ATG03938 [Phytophthora infestans]
MSPVKHYVRTFYKKRPPGRLKRVSAAEKRTDIFGKGCADGVTGNRQNTFVKAVPFAPYGLCNNFSAE